MHDTSPLKPREGEINVGVTPGFWNTAMNSSPKLSRRLVGIVLAGGLGLSAVLPAGRLPFRHYQTADGLPQTQVLALLQDSRGELWVGTWSGAARFDGARFRYLTLRSGLPSSFIFDIVEDQEGNLWFAAGDGLARLDAGQRSQVTTVAYPLFPSPNNGSVRDLIIDHRGLLWAASERGGVAYLEDGEAVPVNTPDILSDTQQVLAETATGDLLVATRDGLFQVEPGGSRRWQSRTGPWNQPVTMVFAAPDGALLFSTTENLWRWDGDRTTEITQQGRAIGMGRSAAVDTLGDLWVATAAGLYRGQATGPVARLGLEEGLRNEDRFYSLLEDRENNLWIGSDGGLTLFPGDLFRIYLASDGLADESVWSVGLDAQGRLLAGTSDGVFRLEDERLTRLPRPNPLRGKMVRAIIADSSGNLWFGTRNSGLFRWNGESWRHFSPPDFPASRIYNAFSDSRGDLWFATRRGLMRFAGDELKVWDHRHGLPNDVVFMVGEDPEGRIVVATAAGMMRLEGSKLVVPPELEPVADVSVRAFVYARDGTLWAGTNGRGLYRCIEGQWSVLLADRDAQGGPRNTPSDDFTWGLIEDRDGRIWLATNQGLDLWNGERWVNFSKRDGLIEDELSAYAALAHPDGSTWFGFSSSGGLVRFPPRQPTVEVEPPIVRITSVTTAAREWADEPFQLTLPWNERDLTFSFIGISFRDADNVVYRTMLEGYDSTFSTPSAATSVRYTNLAPGNYRFAVEAAGSGGTWTAATARVELEIIAPFWRRGWFAALCALAVIAIVSTSHRLRLRRLESRAMKLETRVTERTRELVMEKRKVEEALAEVKTLSGMLPICSACKSVRDDKGYWERIEIYIRDHSEAEFTHGLCPECVGDFLPETSSDKPGPRRHPHDDSSSRVYSLVKPKS